MVFLDHLTAGAAPSGPSYWGAGILWGTRGGGLEN